ncbi:MAG: hypothetical protein IKS48_01030 [Eubacterium sp.]|nr:hypothetical protein [Eubacterium sp.]
MFRRLLVRNIIAVTVPLIIIEFFVLIIALNLSVLDKYSCYEISAQDAKSLETALEGAFAEGKINVRIDCPENMNPAGFDYVVEGNRDGECFYNYLGDSIRLYVLKKDTAKQIKKGKKPNITARLEKLDSAVKEVTSAYETGVTVGGNALEGFVSEIVVNELSYPAKRIKIIDTTKYVAVFMMAFTLLYMVLAILYPSINICLKISCDTGGKSRIDFIKIMDEEMANEKTVAFDNGYYITPNYVVSEYASYTEVKIEPAG